MLSTRNVNSFLQGMRRDSTDISKYSHRCVSEGSTIVKSISLEYQILRGGRAFNNI